MKYPPPPRVFWASKRGGGGPLRPGLWRYSETESYCCNGISGWGSRAVKYNGFAPPPPKKFLKQSLGREKTWKCTLQLVCTYLTRWCIIDSAKIFYFLILPYIKQFVFSWNISRWGGVTPAAPAASASAAPSVSSIRLRGQPPKSKMLQC